MKPVISIGFSDFWGGFTPHDNYFTRLLATRYDVEIADQPELLIYSCFGNEHRRSKARVRIFFTGENVRPNFRQCDYAFSFDHIDRPEHYRLPLYAWYSPPDWLMKGAFDPAQILAQKSGFCNFVYSNPRCKLRIKFFEKLSKYKRVDSGGRLMNNIGGPVADKLAFLRRYKFTIAFENDSYPGYTTEKIAEPMLAWSLPIYWGNPLVHLDFNPRSFLNYFDYGSLDDLVDRVVELDRDDELYCQYLREPWHHGNVVNAYVREENVLAQFERILAADPSGRRRRRLAWQWPIKRSKAA
ncbi:MAG TPA: glycosyltransferase family 10 [Lacipirellula sp.]